MTASRDVVEALTHERRRLVSAFLHGAPHGALSDVTRPGRSVLVGIVLGVLVAGLLLVGHHHPALAHRLAARLL